MPNPNLPAHLVGYDYLAQLEAWADAEPGQRREWYLSSRRFGAAFSGLTDRPDRYFFVKLEWLPADRMVKAVDQVAVSPEEAAWLALETFRLQGV